MNETQIRISAIDNTKKAFDSIRGNLAGLKDQVFSVKGAIAGLVTGAVGTGFLQANRSFQSLQASLITFTGSTEAANAQFAVLQEFAKTTPFALEEVVSGFNKLIARGMEPTIASFQAFGNIAAGTGKSLDQFIEAVADAVTGEFERLKEFGVKASKEGDKVKFTFGGMTTAVANNATEIEGYLRQLGETKFGGAMARQADTLNGAISNLGDSFFQLATSIGESGVNKALVVIIKNMSAFADILTGAFKPENEKRINKLKLGIEELSEALAKIDEKKTKGLGEIRDRNRIQAQLDVLREEIKELKRYEASLNTVAQTAKKTKITPPAATKKLFPELLTLMDVAIPKIREMDEAFALEEPPKLISFFDAIKEKIDQFDYENIKLGKTALEEYALAARNLGNQLDNVAARSLLNLEDALVGVLMGTMSVKDAFKSMAASIIADLARILIQRSITGPIADAIFSSFGGGSGGGYFGGISPRGGAAIGGPLQANSPYMVGERGPELFVPSRSGSIVPNEDMMGGSGVTVNQTINVTTGVQQTVRVEIANLMPQIAEATKAAVLDARKRGGQFASTFA
jgi:hypothetical protein